MANPRATPPSTPTGIPLTVADETLTSWLNDDLGPEGHDVTSEAIFPADHQGSARIVTREALVVSGLAPALRVFQIAGAKTTTDKTDGDTVDRGTVLATIEGPTRAILSAERTALNLLGHLSGIATLTQNTQRRIEQVNPDCKVSATRKTLPGLRALEKLAVIDGGGEAHRYGLFDMALIKDNHRAAAEGLETAIEAVRNAHKDILLEVEVENLEDAETAAHAGVDWLLVDNQDPEALRQIADAVRAISPNVKIEASGGIRPENAHLWAAHAHRVSLGAITMSAPAKDIGLDWTEPASDGGDHQGPLNPQ